MKTLLQLSPAPSTFVGCIVSVSGTLTMSPGTYVNTMPLLIIVFTKVGPEHHVELKFTGISIISDQPKSLVHL